ncbi:13039_t:CDS:2, partial [Acaulospora colombiana]
MTRIAELEQIAKEKNELEVRIVELERSAKENIELRSRVMKLEQIVSQNNSRSGDTIVSKEKSNFIISRSETKQVNTFVPKEQSSANISDTTHKSLEDEEIDGFLDTKRKERVGEEIIQIIKEKKLQDQEVSSGRQDTSPEELISPPLPSHNENSNPEVKLSYSEPKSSTNLLSNQKIPYNQKVERGLRHELFICTKENNDKSSKVFDIQIPEFSLETILTGSSKVTSQNIVDLFRVAMKNSSTSSRQPIPMTNPNKMECLYQYAVENGLDPEKFS